MSAVAAALLCDNAGAAAGILLWLSGWSVGTAFLVHRAWDAWGDALSGPGSRILNTFSALFATAFALPFTAGLIVGAFMLTQTIALLATLALIAGGIASYVFYHLLKAPTLAGSKIFDEIDGFRLFLVTAEKARLEALNPPQVTPEVFERFLPYAIALDCENEWSRKFEAEAAAAGVERGSAYGGYVPIWYSGSSFDRLGAAGFSSALGASMASAAASAATAPGSSSGSGGGGFSGGRRRWRRRRRVVARNRLLSSRCNQLNVMARECGPPSWFCTIENDSRGAAEVTSTPRLRVQFSETAPMSPGWPAFAGHDSYILRFPADNGLLQFGK